MKFGESPEGVAAVNLDLRFADSRGLVRVGWDRAIVCNRQRKRESLAGVDDIGICDPAIGGDQFRPARAFAEIFRGQFPERISAANRHRLCV